MKILKLIFPLLIAGSIVHAQENFQIQETIEVFFKGMAKGDSSIMAQTLTKEATLKSIYTDAKTGKTIVRSEELKKLLLSVANKPVDQVYEERIESYHIAIDGKMGMAWTPYQFFLNGKFSHCGVNLFTLVYTEENWKILSITDTRRRNDCKRTNN
ncbi:nuclear transport factor 2 family protein [Jiulongibacter sp. NS-SX5]|uniref:nuclear transport factor 2 family protein n=1 Tax=Jiulongibacter sp. NS-SX5 TaxID=3463854 RepID=UPI004057CFB9